MPSKRQSTGSTPSTPSSAPRVASPPATSPSSTSASASASASNNSHTLPSQSRHNRNMPSSSSSSSSRASKPSSSSSSSAGSGGKRPENWVTILSNLWDRYQNETASRVLCIDAFLGFLLVVGVLQFVYVVGVGSYPFNAFLSGFSATVGQFVLTASLRMQTNPDNAREFETVSDERAFADYVFGSLVLHFFCVNFVN